VELPPAQTPSSQTSSPGRETPRVIPSMSSHVSSCMLLQMDGTAAEGLLPARGESCAWLTGDLMDYPPTNKHICARQRSLLVRPLLSHLNKYPLYASCIGPVDLLKLDLQAIAADAQHKLVEGWPHSRRSNQPSEITPAAAILGPWEEAFSMHTCPPLSPACIAE
jgi:hypothetical protein